MSSSILSRSENLNMEFFGKVGFQETLLLLSSRKPCIEDSSSTIELLGNKSFVLS
jgi:hypothetical protein